MTTIITATEVVKYSPLSDHFDTGLICDHIKRKEERFAREFLGKDYYAALLNDVVDYTGTEEYDSGTTYNEGDFVLWNGRILESLTDANETAPCDDTDNTKWKAAEKFFTECYNDLYKAYIRPYLAFIIAAEVVDYATYQIGAKGGTEFVEDESGIRSAGKANFQNIKSKLYNDAEEILENLKSYLKDYDGDCNYDQIEWYKDCAPSTNHNYSRKIHFRY